MTFVPFRGEAAPDLETGTTAGGERSFDGIVVGWVNLLIGRSAGGTDSTHLLRVQTARSAVAARAGNIEEHELVLNRTQLRQLGESLIRSADDAEGRSDIGGRVRRWFR